MKLNKSERDYLGEVIECDYIAMREYVEDYSDNDNTKDYKKKMQVANNLYIKLFNVSLED